MQKPLIAILLVIVLVTSVCTPTKSQEKEPLYRAEIALMNRKTKIGVVTAVTETSICVITRTEFKKKNRDLLAGEWIPADNIRMMRFRKADAQIRGFLIGAGIGAGGGGAIGYVSHGECEGYVCPTKTVSSVIGAVVGGVVVGLIGLAAGSANEKFAIDGDIRKYQAVKGQLDKFVLR